jgi:hypothetical protein
MTPITDETMREMMTKTRTYSLVVLRPGPRYGEPDARAIIWEHGRRNFSLRAEGLLSVVCPVGDAEIAGVGVFNADEAAVDALMKEDPAVKAEVLVYGVHKCRGFPGDALPG